MIRQLDEKYYVVKREDIKYLSKEQQNELGRILMDIHYRRIEENKKSNQYIVLNTDETYIDEVVSIMKQNGQLV